MGSLRIRASAHPETPHDVMGQQDTVGALGETVLHTGFVSQALSCPQLKNWNRTGGKYLQVLKLIFRLIWTLAKRLIHS